MPNHGRCAGEEFAAFAGMGIISSYLVLFISFYFATYRKDGKAPSGRKAVRRMSQAPLPDPHDIIGEKAGTANGHVNGKATTTGAKATRPVTRSRKAL